MKPFNTAPSCSGKLRHLIESVGVFAWGADTPADVSVVDVGEEDCSPPGCLVPMSEFSFEKRNIPKTEVPDLTVDQPRPCGRRAMFLARLRATPGLPGTYRKIARFQIGNHAVPDPVILVVRYILKW